MKYFIIVMTLFVFACESQPEATPEAAPAQTNGAAALNEAEADAKAKELGICASDEACSDGQFCNMAQCESCCPPGVAVCNSACCGRCADKTEVKVTPLQHASMILEWEGIKIAVDPIEDALKNAPGDEPKVDVILVTDIHGDHYNQAGIDALKTDKTIIVAPKAVVDMAEGKLDGAQVIGNGEATFLFDKKIRVEGVAMYNLKRKRDSGELFHIKGRGNGYILEMGGQRVYLSGDTECIDEMKALKDIDVAFVCMNLPYTMPVEEAAECIKAFKPKKLYPFHHRGQDPKKLDELLKGEEIEIKYLNWYPAGQ